jgi:5'-methylthioadenosine phosphorylase
MEKKRIGIIGGSGLYHIDKIEILKHIREITPFGEPSDELTIGVLNGREIVFLPRHSRGHRILPTDVNYRANIWIMKKLGVEWIISISAVGSFKDEIQPLDMVLVDQFVDRTTQRRSTFFGEGIAAHIVFADPVCNELRRIIFEAGQDAGEGGRIHWGGTYLNIEGPAFSTKAESLLYKSWGCDVIGMTNATEAKLAREAEICYATIAMVTDYDCWQESKPEEVVNVDIVLKNQKKNIEVVKKIIRNAIAKIPEERSCGCADALKNTIVTDLNRVPEKTLEKLGPIIGKYLKNK